MSFKQLELFKKLDLTKVDRLVTELESLIYDYKYQALLIEISAGKDKAFMWTLEAVRVLGDLAQLIAKDSPKYKSLSKDAWKRKTTYEPYYAALEPRSSIDLVQVCRNSKSRSKAILLRFKPILENFGTPAEQLLIEFDNTNQKILNVYKQEYGIREF